MDKTMKLFLLCVTFSTLLNTIFLTYSVLQSRRPATSYDHDQIVLTNVKYIERERATFIDDGPRWSVSWRFDQRTRCSQYSVVKLLIIIASNPERFSRRSAIRKTWAKASHLYRDADRRVVYLFLVNATSDRTLREQIASENDEHGDIIQSDQPSSLPNNTDLVSLAHWTKKYCANARFVLRVDDRTLVFTDRILSYLYGTEVANLQGSLPSEPSPQRRIEREGVLAYGFMTSYRPLPVTSQPYLLSSSVVHLIMTMSQFVEKIRLNNFTKSPPLLERVEALSTKIEGFGVYGEETRLCEHKSTLLLLCEVDFASMYAIWRDFEQNSCNTTTEEFTMSTKLRPTKTNDMLSAHATNASTSNNSQVNDLPSYRTGYTQCEAEYANKSNVFLLVLTYSEPGHLQERTAIRKTRGTLVSAMGRKIVQLFLIPGSPELTKNGTIQDESNLHKDIFILDVKDKKMPILKFLMMYNNFVVKLCPQYVMRVDDNFFVNLNSLVQVLVGAPRSRFFLSSTSNTSAKVKVKNNNLNFKQTVKYQSSDITDSVYVMSADVAADIYAASHHFDVICHPGTPDIGCLLHHLGISVVHHEGIDLSGKKRSLCETKEVLASGHVSESLMYAIWQNLDQWGAFISCSSDSELNLKREFDLNGDERIKIAGGRIVGMPPENRTTGSSSFLINHFEKCGSKVFLFVGILSRPGNQKLREIIRHTWAMYNEKIPGLRIETLFFIGVDKNLKIQNAIRKENQKYSDIIQVNFVDLYKNLVLKTLSIFHWAKHYCDNAKYLLKVDDDVFVHYRNLVKFLKFAPRTNFYMGNAQVDTMPYRSTGYKWYTPKEVWPGKVYPPYADGPAYVVSMDVVPRALHQSTVTPIFKWEDIYIGVLLQNLNVVPYPHIYFDSKGFHRNPCTFQAVLTSHHFSMHMLPKFWKMTKKAVEKETCDGIFLQELEPNFLRDSDDNAVQFPSNVNVSSIDNPLPLSAAPAKKQLFLCVIVMTTPLQHEQRRFIRMTVGRNDVILGRQIMVRFMTDISRENNMQKFIEQERELYQDMLFFQPSNSTTYHQSTKLVTALRWAATTPADFVMVMDASDYVNIFNVVQELQAAPRTDYVTCHVKKLSPVVRTKESIWYVSKKEWSPDAYPAHCDKRAPFILSSDVLRKLLSSVQGRQLFKFPDVFLGILLKDAKLTLIHKENFIVNLADKQVATDNLNVERLCDLKKPLSIHGFFARHRSAILKHSLTENTKCKL